jgi:hypothetical protein
MALNHKHQSMQTGAAGYRQESGARISAIRRVEKVDACAAHQKDRPGRSEAVRRLVEIGLKAKNPK